MLRGAKVYNKNHSVWWFPTPYHAYLEVKYWKLRRIQDTTHVSITNEINQILTKLPKTSVIHDLHDSIYCWKYERKAKNILYQSLLINININTAFVSTLAPLYPSLQGIF